MTPCSTESIPSYDEEVTSLYKIRWVLLIVFSFIEMTVGFVSTSFGVSSSTYATFFNQSAATIDLLTTGRSLGSIIAVPIFAYMNLSKRFTLRRLILGPQCLKIVALTLIVLSSISPDYFAMAFVGVLIEGNTNTAMCLVFAFIPLWFPDEQIGSALAIVSMSLFVGYTLAYTIPPNVLPHVPVNGTNETEMQNWEDEVAHDMLCMYIPCVVINLICLILIYFFLIDAPPKPPTVAQAAKRVKVIKLDATPPEDKNGEVFLALVKQLMANMSFIIDCTISGLLGQSFLVEVILLNEALFEITDASETAVLSGKLLITMIACLVIGMIFAGVLIDRFKSYKVQIITSTALACLSAGISIAGFDIPALWVLYLGHALTGFTSGLGSIPTIELSTQHTYPMDETFVSFGRQWIVSVIAFILPEIGRVIFDSTGSGVSIFLYQMGLLGICFLLSFAISESYKRLEYENRSKRNREETTLLVQKN